MTMLYIFVDKCAKATVTLSATSLNDARARLAKTVIRPENFELCEVKGEAAWKEAEEVSDAPVSNL